MFQNVSPVLGEEVAKNVTYTLIILVLAIIARIAAQLIIQAFLKRLEDGDNTTKSTLERRAHTIAGLATNVVNVVLLASAAIMIMSEWGINVAPIITSLGILGLAVGFGTQKLVQDIVTGFFILFENQYNIGDKVKVAGVEGTVTEMNLRTTILKDDAGNCYIIPNSQVNTVEKRIS